MLRQFHVVLALWCLVPGNCFGLQTNARGIDNDIIESTRILSSSPRTESLPHQRRQERRAMRDKDAHILKKYAEETSGGESTEMRKKNKARDATGDLSHDDYFHLTIQHVRDHGEALESIPLAQAQAESSNSSNHLQFSGYVLRSEYASDSTCTGTPSWVFLPLGQCLGNAGTGLKFLYYDNQTSLVWFNTYAGFKCNERSVLQTASLQLDNSTCYPATGYTGSMYDNYNAYTMSYVSALPTVFPVGIVYRNYSTQNDCYQQSSLTAVIFRPAFVCLRKNVFDRYLAEWGPVGYYFSYCYNYYYYSYIYTQYKDFGEDLTCTSKSNQYYTRGNYLYNCQYQYNEETINDDQEGNNNDYYHNESITDDDNRYFQETYMTAQCGGPSGSFYPIPTMAPTGPTAPPTPQPTVNPNSSIPGYYVQKYFSTQNWRQYSRRGSCPGNLTYADVYQLGSCNPQYSSSDMYVARPIDNSTTKFGLDYYSWYNSWNCEGAPSYHYTYRYSSEICVDGNKYEISPTSPNLGPGLEWANYKTNDCGRQNRPFYFYWESAINCQDDYNLMFCHENWKTGETVYSQAYFDGPENTCSGRSYAVNYTESRCYARTNWNGVSYNYEGLACHGGNYNVLANANPELHAVKYRKSDYSLFGEFYNNGGYYYYSDPPTVTCLEACALQFGGSPGDYVGSIRRDRPTGTCFGKMRYNYNGNIEIPHNFTFCETYYKPGCISAYVSDYSSSSTNYCFKSNIRDPTKYKPQFLCEPYSTGNTNGANVRYGNCSIYACDGDRISINGGCLNVTGPDGSYCSDDQYFRLYDERGNEVASNDDSCSLCAAISIRASGPCQMYQLREGCYAALSCGGTTAVKVEKPKKHKSAGVEV